MHAFRKTFLMALAGALIGAGAAAQEPGDPKAVIARYGKPDKVKSNEFERPRPSSITKVLVYRKPGVHFVFTPEAAASAPPPYKDWRLAAVRDARYGTALTREEIERRMQPRAAAASAPR